MSQLDHMIEPVRIPTKRNTHAPRHLWEEAANEIVAWLDEMEVAVADALLFKGRSPFAADLSEAEKLEYYRATLATPEGRQALMERVGVDQYVQVVAALAESTPGALPAAPRERERRDREAPGYGY